MGQLFSPPTSRILFWAWSAVLLIAIGVLGVRQHGEPDRTTRQLQIDCAFYGDIAKAPLPSNASALGRRIVQDAAESYDKRGCERISGPLPSLTAGADKPAPSAPSSPASD